MKSATAVTELPKAVEPASLRASSNAPRDLTIDSVFRPSWEAYKVMWGPLVFLLGLAALLIGFFTILTILYSGQTPLSNFEPVSFLLAAFLLAIASLILPMGLIRVGIKALRFKEPKITDLFPVRPLFSWIIVSLVVSTLTSLAYGALIGPALYAATEFGVFDPLLALYQVALTEGEIDPALTQALTTPAFLGGLAVTLGAIALLSLPGSYLSIRLGMAYPLIADARLPIAEAIPTAWRISKGKAATLARLLGMAAGLFLFALLAVLGFALIVYLMGSGRIRILVLAFGLSFLVLWPWAYLAFLQVYRIAARDVPKRGKRTA